MKGFIGLRCGLKLYGSGVQGLGFKVFGLLGVQWVGGSKDLSFPTSATANLQLQAPKSLGDMHMLMILLSESWQLCMPKTL